MRSVAMSQRSVKQAAPGGQEAQASPQVTEAMKMAERLFETSTVMELREVCWHQPVYGAEVVRTCVLQHNALQVETRTQSDINDKGRQLQQLVGGSYRCGGVGSYVHILVCAVNL